MKTTVVILNWNGRALMEKFLPSVLEYSADLAQIVVADNCSEDGSIEMLRNRFPSVQVIQHPENWGFSKGYNEALRQLDSDLFVLLNSDVEVTENWLEPLVQVMKGNPQIGACQPKIRCYDATQYFEYAGAAGGFIDAYGYPFCRGRLFDVLEEDCGQYDDPCDIFWATGACLVVRSSVYHELGGLDEDFFAHMEEIDLCWRMKNAGYRLMARPESVVYHIGGGALPKTSPRKTYLNFRNNLLLLVKNLPSKQLVPVLVIRYFLDLFACAVFLLKRKPADARAVWSAHVHFFRMLPRFLKKRRAGRQREVDPVYRGSIVFDHFVRGVKSFANLRENKWNREDKSWD